MAEASSSVRFRNSPFNAEEPRSSEASPNRRPLRSTFSRKRGASRLVKFSEPDTDQPTSSSIYTGSYARSAQSRANSLRSDAAGSLPGSNRTSISHVQLEHLLDGVDDTETYGLHELRDGFFDASFSRAVPPLKGTNNDAQTALNLSTDARATIQEFLWQLAHDQLESAREVYKDVFYTRTGVRLLKAFIGFFIAYIICLIPVARTWLGSYFYILPVSALINHPARSFGSQIDGALLTCFGTTIGLLWGGLAIYTTTATATAAKGYGAAIVPFLMLFAAILGWLRAFLNRFFQAIICAGIALFYMSLAEDLIALQGPGISIWHRFSQFAIPFVIGQALCLIVNFAVFPSAGNRPLAMSFHAALISVRSTLVLPRPASMARNRDLAVHFVQVSQAVRDFTLDLAYSAFTPDNARSLRNLVQAVLRAMIALEPSTELFELSSQTQPSGDEPDPAIVIAKIMANPTRALIESLDQSIRLVDSVLMHISELPGYRDGDSAALTSSGNAMLHHLTKCCNNFDEAEASLANTETGPAFSPSHEDIVDLFLFIHPIRQAADKVVSLLEKAVGILEAKPVWKLRLPSYPWSKAFYRMNPQVRHDRGGLTAGYYFASKRQLNKTMDELQSRDWRPLEDQKPRKGEPKLKLKRSWTLNDDSLGPEPEQAQPHNGQSKLRYALWSISHRLQDFEARFAVKITLLCTLLSIPGLLPQSAPWWYSNDCWWVIVTIWIMMHPRVGGNFADLLIRTSCAALGAIWAGLACAARQGNPYVVAAFAAIFMIPMIYRYTQSKHPRSGIIGCLTFTVCSLIIDDTPNNTGSSIIDVAWTRGLVFIVGVVTAVLVNWILWPFVARHELRKSISTMILNSAIIYRSVIARYIYYAEGQEPGKEDIERSEMLEGRLREGFVRIRQLMELTRHEIRVRAPFDPFPYGALIDACEQFFDRLVDVRQASLFFKPTGHSAADNAAHNLLALRRDAVASILMTLYVIAGALRSHSPLPKWLPSAAQARRRLLDAMEVVEAERTEEHVRLGKVKEGGRRHSWGDVYEYAYSASLTDIVGQVQELEARTRGIVGVVGYPKLPKN